MVIVADVVLIVINTSKTFLQNSQNLRILLYDLLTLFGFSLLWLANRKGKIDLAAHISLTICILVTNFIFEPQDLIHAFVIFTIPILLSSFVLSSGWVFFYTTLAVIVYSLIFILTLPAVEYRYLIVISLYTFASISYFISSRYTAAMQQVQASENRVRSLFEHVPVGLYRTTADGQILEANPTLLKMFGYQDLKTFQKLNAVALYAATDEHSQWQDTFTKMQ